MSKLIQLKLGAEKLAKYTKLVDLLGYKGTFGEYQKAIDFSIDFTISELERSERVLPCFDTGKLDVFLSTIARIRKARDKAALLRKIAAKS